MGIELRDKVALVTGAGSGIGKATTLLLGKQGMKVAAEVRRAGGDAIPIVADTARDKQMKQAIQQIVDHWQRLDAVFANAGINGVWGPIEELTLDDWLHTLNTNLTGTFLTIKYATHHLKREGGSIVVTSSVNGTRVFSNTGATAYSTS